MSKYKFAVKRGSASKKDIGKVFKRVAKGGIKARDVGRAISQARRSPGGIPRIDAVARVLTGGQPSGMNSAAAQAQQRRREDELYRMLDGGTRDVRYVTASAPSKSSSSKSSSSSSQPSSSSPQSSGTSYGSGSIYSDQIGKMMEMLRMQQEAFNKRYGQQQADFQRMFGQYQSMFGKYQQQAASRAAKAEKRYEDLMIAQQRAAAKAAAEREEQARQDALSRQTMMANQMRAASGMPQLKIGAPDPTGIGGTSDFRRRIMQGMQGMNYGGINV